MGSARALSERSLASAAKISRSCLRDIKEAKENLTLSSLCTTAEFFGRNVEVIVAPDESESELSIVATAYKIQRDGFESWRIHLMDFLDGFRRTSDPRLILLPPPRGFDTRLTALFASLTRFLCEDSAISTPRWALRRYFLPTPWFVAEIQSLKASALIESPIAFRNNNIYVLQNFTSRA